MIAGLLEALSPIHLLLMAVGVAGGVIVGCLPGLTATMGLALLTPFTFAMDPIAGLMMLGGLYVGAMYGDAIPACLVNVPGTPSAFATSLDGFPMTKQGRGREALLAACYSSAIGALFGGLALLLLSPPLAQFSLRFGPPEFFWLGVLALTIMGSLVGDSFLRGLSAGLFGLLLSTVGVATTGGATRFTFGFYQLTGGISLPVALIGLFAIPQLINLVQNRGDDAQIAELNPARGVIRKVLRLASRPVNLIRSSVIGIVVGILPGAGSPIAAIISYNEAARWSNDRSSFGKGNIDGVVASESANNSAAPASMVPLLTLGVPGSSPSAVILGALLLHGLRPGPDLYQNSPEIVFAFIWAMILGGFTVFALGLVMTPLLVRVVEVPIYALVPAITALTIVGSYAIRNNAFDVYLMFAIGIAGYLFTRVGVPVAPIALGLILGPIVESGLTTSLSMANSAGMMPVFVLRPISALFIVLTIASIIWTIYSRRSGGSLIAPGGGADDADSVDDTSSAKASP